jgi:hypothetical protein
MMKTKLAVGQKVEALVVITEGGDAIGDTVGDPNAIFPSPYYIHALIGEHGVVEMVDCDVATVRFDRTGTATIVSDEEVKVLV